MLYPLLSKAVAIIINGKLKAARIVLLETVLLKLTTGTFGFLIRYLNITF